MTQLVKTLTLNCNSCKCKTTTLSLSLNSLQSSVQCTQFSSNNKTLCKIMSVHINLTIKVKFSIVKLKVFSKIFKFRVSSKIQSFSTLSKASLKSNMCIPISCNISQKTCCFNLTLKHNNWYQAGPKFPMKSGWKPTCSYIAWKL